MNTAKVKTYTPEQLANADHLFKVLSALPEDKQRKGSVSLSAQPTPEKIQVCRIGGNVKCGWQELKHNERKANAP